MNQNLNTEKILNFIKENNLTKKVFCKKCKISPATLNKILENKTNFYLVALFKIARVMNVQISQLVK